MPSHFRSSTPHPAACSDPEVGLIALLFRQPSIRARRHRSRTRCCARTVGEVAL